MLRPLLHCGASLGHIWTKQPIAAHVNQFKRKFASLAAPAATVSQHPKPVAALNATNGPSLPPNIKFDNRTVDMIAREAEIEKSRQTYVDYTQISSTVPVISFTTAQPTGAEVHLDRRVFTEPPRPDIVHSVVVWQEKNRRTTLYKAKSRGEVRGGGRKPWPQKGTGRSRQGSIRSPLWKGGGAAHGAVHRDWSIDLPRRVRQLGMRVVLAARFRERRLTIIDHVALPEGKTRTLLDTLARHEPALGEQGRPRSVPSLLIIDAAAAPVDSPEERALRNVGHVTLVPAEGASVRTILRHHRLWITVAGLRQLTDRVTRLPHRTGHLGLAAAATSPFVRQRLQELGRLPASDLKEDS